MTRTRVLVALMASIALTVGALTVPQAAQAATAYSVNLTGPTPIKTGATVYLRGTVSPAAPGTKVSVQEYYAGAWHQLKTATLTSTSSYRVSLPAGSTAKYRKFRVVKPASSTRPRGVSATLGVTVTDLKYSVSLAYTGGAGLKRNDNIELSGSIAPATPGRTITLQEWNGTTWVNRATATSSLYGAFPFVTKATSPGLHRYRAVIAGYGKYLGSASPSNLYVPVAGNVLQSGERAIPGSNLASANGRFGLTVAGDGLVIETNRDSGRGLWNNGIFSKSAAHLIMQSDGNLVLYSTTGQALWSTGTAGNPGARFVIQDDGNLVVYSAGGKALWASSTINDKLGPGERLLPGWSLRSADGRYHLDMQGDGNLVVYAPDKALWASNTAGHPGAWAVMQGDGNLVIYPGGGGNALWASNTAGNSGAWSVMQSDSNFVIYGATALWASNATSSGNAAIADVALGYVGQYGGAACVTAGKSGYTGGNPLGSGNNMDGECKAFVNCVVWIASGHTVWLGGGANEFSAFYAKGTEISWATAAKGDIVQWPASSGLHTAIVVSNLGGGRLDVVDSNWGLDHKVAHHTVTQSWRAGSKVFHINM